MRKSITAFAALAMLTACGGGEDGANSGVTAEEGAKLDEMNQVMEVEPDSLAATEDAPLGNGEAPAQAGELPVDGNDAGNGL